MNTSCTKQNTSSLIHGGVSLQEMKKLALRQQFGSTLEDVVCIFSSLIVLIEHQIIVRSEIIYVCKCPAVDGALKMAEAVDHVLHSRSHFIRAQFVSGHNQKDSTRFRNVMNHRVFCSAQQLDGADIRYRGKYFRARFNLLQSSCKKNFDGGHPPKESSLVGFQQKFCSMFVLLAHYKNRHAQSCYRAYRLNPSRPAVLCQASIVANARGNDRSRHQCNSKKNMGFLHESIQSCLKGILA